VSHVKQVEAAQLRAATTFPARPALTRRQATELSQALILVQRVRGFSHGFTPALRSTPRMSVERSSSIAAANSAWLTGGGPPLHDDPRRPHNWARQRVLGVGAAG